MKIFSTLVAISAITSTQAMEFGLNFTFKSNPEITITESSDGRTMRALLKEGDYTETIVVEPQSTGFICFRQRCSDKKQLVEYGNTAKGTYDKLVRAQEALKKRAAKLKAEDEFKLQQNRGSSAGTD